MNRLILNRNGLTGILLTGLIFWLLLITPILAASSADYIISPNDTGTANENNSNSIDFQINCQQLGDVVSGKSASTDYSIQHGFYCPGSNDTTIDFTCLPANRYLGGGPNYSSYVTIEVRPAGGDVNSFIFSEQVQTDINGQYVGLTLTGITPGTYDISCKGWNTLRTKKNNFVLGIGNTSIDFSNGGTTLALAGDLNDSNEGNRLASTEQGDNDISAADYSNLVGNYNNTPGPAEERRDLDKAGGNATAADYSIIVFNYNQVGD